jgi:hypothetical protein
LPPAAQLFVYRSFIAAARYLILKLGALGTILMTSTDMPTALIEQPAQAVVAAQSAKNDWAETALTLLFAAAAILFVSFVAVVTGLV